MNRAYHGPNSGSFLKGATSNMPVIVRRSKRYKKAARKPRPRRLQLMQAIDVLKAFPPTKFDQSVELIFSLGIDPKQADQMIRGSLSLPHGVGKSKRVVAFCPEHLVAAATAAGAIARAGRNWCRRSRRKTSPISTSPSRRPT